MPADAHRTLLVFSMQNGIAADNHEPGALSSLIQRSWQHTKQRYLVQLHASKSGSRVCCLCCQILQCPGYSNLGRSFATVRKLLCCHLVDRLEGSLLKVSASLLRLTLIVQKAELPPTPGRFYGDTWGRRVSLNDVGTDDGYTH